MGNHAWKGASGKCTPVATSSIALELSSIEQWTTTRRGIVGKWGGGVVGGGTFWSVGTCLATFLFFLR